MRKYCSQLFVLTNKDLAQISSLVMLLIPYNLIQIIFSSTKKACEGFGFDRKSDQYPPFDYIVHSTGAE